MAHDYANTVMPSYSATALNGYTQYAYPGTTSLTSSLYNPAAAYGHTYAAAAAQLPQYANLGMGHVSPLSAAAAQQSMVNRTPANALCGATVSGSSSGTNSVVAAAGGSSEGRRNRGGDSGGVDLTQEEMVSEMVRLR